MRSALALATAATLWTVAPAPATQPQQIPAADMRDTDGTKLLTTLCGSCHTRGSIVGTHRQKQDWEEVIEWMIDEGAVMSDEEFERILDYLSARYGRVAINAAPAGEIRHVLEFTAAQAERLIAARNAGRRLTALAEVAEAAGVPVEFLEARKARIDFE